MSSSIDSKPFREFTMVRRMLHKMQSFLLLLGFSCVTADKHFNSLSALGYFVSSPRMGYPSDEAPPPPPPPPPYYGPAVAADYEAMPSPEDPDGDSIFGTAGKDYPTLNSVPNTGFTCASQAVPGYYADPGASCQVFHICQADGTQDSFLCPNGSIFNQQVFVCDWWYNVDCSKATSFYNLNEGLFKEPAPAPAPAPSYPTEDTYYPKPPAYPMPAPAPPKPAYSPAPAPKPSYAPAPAPKPYAPAPAPKPYAPAPAPIPYAPAPAPKPYAPAPAPKPYAPAPAPKPSYAPAPAPKPSYPSAPAPKPPSYPAEEPPAYY